MNIVQICVLLAVCAIGHSFPRGSSGSVKNELRDFESSGSENNEPTRGMVKVVRMAPDLFQRPGLFGRAALLRGGAAQRAPLPAFLALGRPGPVHSEPLKRHHSPPSMEMRRKQGLEMWHRAMDKSSQEKEGLPLPINLKDTYKQSCSAIPFMQRVTEEGCAEAALRNRLCFGQCSSLYVPAGSEPSAVRSPCSRCFPSKSRLVTVTLQCRGDAVRRDKHVLVVDECSCETGREDLTPHHRKL